MLERDKVSTEKKDNPTHDLGEMVCTIAPVSSTLTARSVYLQHKPGSETEAVRTSSLSPSPASSVSQQVFLRTSLSCTQVGT
ncbi:hypothetical protein BaRGS_00017235 [Batillaria attramentaria]|uniref:Uncharacterized protein n=1 Tax=Batillaria attramentaria TaxID=370345 RepID=A0ABD0KX07_9CAEN